MNRPRDLYLLVLPEVHLLDLAAPAQIFAHRALADCVRLRYIAPTTELRAHQGLHLSRLEPLPDSLEGGAWLMLIGTSSRRTDPDALEYRAVEQWLRRMSNQYELVAGICSGTLLAARAGLLDGRRCTTHHDLTDTLRRLAPKALVQDDCIFVRDGDLWTSAGITTGLDLCLQLVVDHWGQETAVAIARELVLYQRRSGHEAQLSFWLDHRNHLQSRVHAVQDLIMAQPGHGWTQAELAKRVHLSERHLRRLFQQATGISLQDYLQQARLELARQLLEQTRFSLAEIAERCGFQAERSLRRTWARWQSGTPGQYRRARRHLSAY
ncbi:AraC family transcriptional regulator [Litchfieldella qijiaojingensis]|uniref:AraC family transcriptional regulator n=1 Tax=Litchfieldella qijiaojingensis TaxID=980347 RepID=A0ABQ2YML0_9GAMM|nr:helix-turn-helix domain-containing protein [Halomonas qijiaojingensis]GGX89404.1 AraC family transcriptional regulator [Halomonas qijiaojingensis]